jgi:Tfp pilus assembly protein PilN
MNLPGRLRWFTLVCLLLTVALAAVVLSATAGAQSTWSAVTGRRAPQVLDATGLYQSLTDLDAQTANIMVFGDDPRLAAQRATALAQYAQDRTGADRDLQQATVSAAGDPRVQSALAGVLDGMGSYQDLAGRAMELNDRARAAAGHPDPTALTEYRRATDLMRTTLLPAADRLVQANNAAFTRSYDQQRSALSTAESWTLGLGAALLTGLLALQVWLTRTFRRIVNPALAAATLLAVAFLALAGTLLPDQGEQLRVARHDAFDSVVALSRARAVVSDANADESRYLLDRDRAPQYQDAFQTASQQIAALPGADITGYDAALAAAIAAYRADHTDIRFGGFYGTEFRNITFPGERQAAEQALTTYQSYQLDDRRIRTLVAAGRLNDAIAYGTSLAPGGSNAAFEAHDTALHRLIAINTDAFTTAAHDGRNQLTFRTPLLAGTAALVLLLCLLGVRPRLAEFRA